MDSTTPLVNLLRALSQWRDALEALHYTVAEDRPGDLAVADLYETAVGDIAGWLEDAAQCTRRSILAMEKDGDAAAGTALAAAHHHILNAALHQTEQLLCSERQRLMHDLPRRGPSWAGWLRIVRASTDSLPRLAHAAHEALLQAWELAASNRCAVRVSAVATGQHFAAGTDATPLPEPASIH